MRGVTQEEGWRSQDQPTEDKIRMVAGGQKRSTTSTSMGVREQPVSSRVHLGAVTCLDLCCSLSLQCSKPWVNPHHVPETVAQLICGALPQYHPRGQMARGRIGREAAKSYTAPAWVLESAMGEKVRGQKATICLFQMLTELNIVAGTLPGLKCCPKIR